MNTSTQANAKPDGQDSEERLSRTIRKIKEVLSGVERQSLFVKRIQGKWFLQIVVGVPVWSAHPAGSYQIDIDGKSGLISVKNAIKVAKIVADSAQPDPRAMRILTEYLEEEWATFRLADVHREVAKYDAKNPNKPYVPRCMSCGLPADTSACVPCRRALARTLANLDVALALFVKEEVSVFRIGNEGMSISVGDAVYRMWQSGGILSHENVRDLCALATVVPYDEGGLVAFGMMSNQLNAGASKAVSIRDETRKDMMSFGKPEAVGTVQGGAGCAGSSGGGMGCVQGVAVAAVRGGASGGGAGGLTDGWTAKKEMGMWDPTGEAAEAIKKAAEDQKEWRLSVQSHPHVYWNGSSTDQKATLLSTDFLMQGEASWPHCIDKDGNVSGDLLDTLYEFYERLREKDSTYPKIVRKDFVAKDAGMFMHIEHGPFIIDRIPWGKSTKASTLSAIEFAMDRAIKENTPEHAGHLAVMLSVFQDMFAPKDDSALWGPSCD